jgi:hypothetical protein
LSKLTRTWYAAFANVKPVSVNFPIWYSIRRLTLEQKEARVQETTEGILVCGGNLSSPVTDTANYIEQVHYKIGTRFYIENAD